MAVDTHEERERKLMIPDVTQREPFVLTEVTDHMVAVSHALLPGDIYVLTISVDDSDHFMKLPPVLSFRGRMYGKSGWNSDLMRAYFRTDALIAKVED